MCFPTSQKFISIRTYEYATNVITESTLLKNMRIYTEMIVDRVVLQRITCYADTTKIGKRYEENWCIVFTLASRLRMF